jgi:hypothetical protein
MSRAARCLHGRLAEAMAAVIGSNLLKSRLSMDAGRIALAPVAKRSGA